MALAPSLEHVRDLVVRKQRPGGSVEATKTFKKEVGKTQEADCRPRLRQEQCHRGGFLFLG